MSFDFGRESGYRGHTHRPTLPSSVSGAAVFADAVMLVSVAVAVERW